MSESNEITEFPRFPTNGSERRMLQVLTDVGNDLANSSHKEDDPTVQHGIALLVFAGSPEKDPYLYYRLYDVLHPLYIKWQEEYNSEVVKLSQAEKLALLESNMDPGAAERIMDIQRGMIPIQSLGAESEHASPIAIILWCYVFTWFDKEKWQILYKTIKDLIARMLEEDPLENQMKELEKMIEKSKNTVDM